MTKPHYRYYKVTDSTTNRLVHACTQQQALRHVAKGVFDVCVASQDDMLELLKAGVKPEVAGVTQDDEE